MNQEAERQAQRGTVLATMMTILGGSLFIFFLFLACGGLWIYVLLVAVGMAAFGGLQYLLWGRAMSAEVAKDAEENTAKEDAIPDREEAKDWTPEERNWYRRF
jgi:hypothetical protein